MITLLSGSSQHLSEILATLPARWRAGVGMGAGVGAEVPTEAIYRHQIEAAAPNLVLTAPRRALRSPASQLRMILKVLQMLYLNTLIFAIWV